MSIERIAALVAAHTLGMTPVLPNHPLGLLGLTLVVGSPSLVVLLGCGLLLTFHLTLSLAHCPRL